MGSSPCHDYKWTRREIYNIFLEFFRGYKSKAFSLLFEDFIVKKIWWKREAIIKTTTNRILIDPFWELNAYTKRIVRPI